MSTLWTPEDVEMLCSLAGDLPWPMVPAAFNRARPHRTATALRRKADGLGLLRRSVGQFITAGAIVGIAGFNYERIRQWILSGELKSRRYGEGSAFPYYICRKDLRAFARKHPEQFGGLRLGELVQLFDSEKLAEEIAAMELPRLSQKVPVMCVDTGKRFESIQAAARAAYVTPTRMQTVLREGTTANGLRYRRVVAMTQQGRAA